jgi:pimeloyl-ACP methyl ester carboxylesterase
MATEETDPSAWRDPVLGPARKLDLPGGSILCHDVGSGPVIVFLHGLLVNANLWRKLVALLKDDFRCVVPDLPIGSHLLPLPDDAGNGPHSVAELAADLIEQLDLEDVTIVGNDSGGAISQVLVTTRPERVGALVLTSCDYRDNFPPKPFSYIKLGGLPGGVWALAQSLRIKPLRRTPIAFGWLSKSPIDPRAENSYLGPVMKSAGVRRDTRSFIRGVDRQVTNEAADLLGNFDRPALIAWSGDDRLFPADDARSLAQDLPKCRLEFIDDAYTFSMEDNPEDLAALIRDFLKVAEVAS